MSDLTINSIVPQLGGNLATNRTYVGIDFGTSTSVVSIASYDSTNHKLKTESIRIPQFLVDGSLWRGETLPSVIAFYNGKILVGKGAYDLKYKLTRGKDVWYEFKMGLGENLGPQYYDTIMSDNQSPFQITNPKEATVVFFNYLQQCIQQYCQGMGLSQNIDYAVSIPASFESNQRRDLIEALESNGFKITNRALIDEPNAAFVSYLQYAEDAGEPIQLNPNHDSKVLVFDFGGGTCDISLLEVGQGAEGTRSKNIAISKYLPMGGKDIDRYITFHYILPRFLEQNGKNESDFITKDREFIAQQLYGISEKLKIEICRKLEVLTSINNFRVPEMQKQSADKAMIREYVQVETRKGILAADEFWLSNKELSETMYGVFTSRSRIPKRIKGEGEYNNIFMPIYDVLEKSKTQKNDIDYVLLIGGSAKNPFIQEALHDFFDESEILIPRDLQTHVSQGAAIHSLLYNGAGYEIIKPITSEPIFVIIRGQEGRRILLPANTVVPSETIVVSDLIVEDDHQKEIELPLCVGSTNKMIANIKISSPSSNGFSLHERVQVAIQINADKLLMVSAKCGDQICSIEPQNPFVNKELTTEQRAILVAERNLNIDALNNGGIPTRSSLLALKRAYEDAGNDFMAAETMERLLSIYHTENDSDYNNIGVLYHNSGNIEKAIEFYERALSLNPNNCHAKFNLGHSLKGRDRRRYEQYMQETLASNPEHYCALIEMAGIDDRNGRVSEAKLKRKKAFDLLMEKWKSNTMSSSDYSWLIRIAKELGRYSIAREVEQSQNNVSSVFYNDENLVGRENKMLTQK